MNRDRISVETLFQRRYIYSSFASSIWLWMPRATPWVSSSPVFLYFCPFRAHLRRSNHPGRPPGLCTCCPFRAYHHFWNTIYLNLQSWIKIYTCPGQRLQFFVQPGLNGQVYEHTLPFIISSPTVQPRLNAKCKTMTMRVHPYIVSPVKHYHRCVWSIIYSSFTTK